MLDFRSLGDEELKKQLVQAFGDNKDAAQQVINSLISDRSSAVFERYVTFIDFYFINSRSNFGLIQAVKIKNNNL